MKGMSEVLVNANNDDVIMALNNNDSFASLWQNAVVVTDAIQLHIISHLNAEEIINKRHCSFLHSYLSRWPTAGRRQHRPSAKRSALTIAVALSMADMQLVNSQSGWS